MASELDPVLIRALNLLHSKHPRALEQLCALRDELLGKKPEYVPDVKEKKKKEDSKKSIEVETANKAPSPKRPEVSLITISSDSDGVIEELPETRSFGKDANESITETVEVESSLLANNERADDDEMIEMVEELGVGFVEETLEELSSSGLLKKRPKLEISTGKTIVDDLDVVSSESSPDPEMSGDLGVPKCVVCSSGKSGLAGNQLVECHECHELYHQNCHKPRIADQNINDLRHVWYCRNCSKQMKQAAPTSAPPKPKPSSSPVFSFNKPQTLSFKAPLRVEPKSPMFPPISPSSNQSFLIPNLPTTTNSAVSGGLKSPGNVNPRDVARNSMKRLQLVKKKAAAKNQQRFNNKR